MTDNQMMFNQPEMRSKPPLAPKLTSKRQPVVLDWDEVAYGRARPASGLGPAPPLFPRVDEPTLAA